MSLDRANGTLVNQHSITEKNNKNGVVVDGLIIKKTNKPNNFESLKAKI
jgi:hypothetical protein